MSVHILERDGQPAFVILPIEDYERLISALEDVRDAAVIEEFHKKLVSTEEETLPIEIADRILEGENPVRVMRRYRGLTLQQLADSCGVTDSHISQIELGKRSMSTDLLKKVAETLNTDLELLI